MTPSPSLTRGRGTTAKGLTLVYAQIFPVMAIVSLFPAIPRLFQQFGQLPNAALLVPMVVTMPSLCVALGAPMAGWVADRFGRRPCFVGAMAAYVVFGLAPLVLDDLRAIVASRALFGISEAFVVTVSSTLIGDYFGEQRYRWVAWVGAATSVAGTALIAIGGALADVSWRGPFAVYGFAIPAFFLALIFIDEPVPEAQAHAQPALTGAGFPWREALIIGSVTIVASLIYYVEPLNIATILTDRGIASATAVGLLQAATALPYIAGAFVYRHLHARPIGVLLALAGMLMGVGMIGIGVSGGARAAAAAALAQQLGAGMVIPALLAWAQATLPLEQRGRGMGIWATAFFAGTFLCPPLVTWVTAHAGSLSQAFVWLGSTALVLAIAAPFVMGSAANSEPQTTREEAK